MFDVLLPDPMQVRCDDVSVLEENEEILLQLVANSDVSACPRCHQETRRIHSRYCRHLVDLPWANVPVSIQLQVRRFFCLNDDCPQVIFCERLPGVVAPWARRTERLAEAQGAIGLALGGAAGARLSVILIMKVGIDLLLSLIRQRARLEKPTPRVLGVDDWAKCKGQRYGTVLVDLEQGEIVDLLADRTAETLSEWLSEHPGIEMVTRDRSQTYADAIQAGAPEAIQVADRWHLLKNLSDAVFKILEQEHSVIKQQLVQLAEREQSEDSAAELFEAMPTAELEALTPSEQRRQERIGQAQQLNKQGWTQKDIALHLNIHPKTVRRYLSTSTPEAKRHRPGKRLLDPFQSHILKRWLEGCHNAAQLLQEIQKQGYSGKITIVRDFVRQLRQTSRGVLCWNGHCLDSEPTKRQPSLRALTWFIVKQPAKRSEEEEKVLAQISTGQPKLAVTIRLARELAAIIRERQVEPLDEWLEQASNSGFQIWRNFANSLRKDYAAVRAALLYPWSNGPTEGHVNRLKCLKRDMYGRAKLDLLWVQLVAA